MLKFAITAFLITFLPLGHAKASVVLQNDFEEQIKIKFSALNTSTPLNRFERQARINLKTAKCVTVIQRYKSQYTHPDSEIIGSSPINHLGYKTVQKGTFKDPLKVFTHLEAQVTNYHVSKCKEQSFSSSIDWRMRELGAWKGDERGHILARQLCGPKEWYNVTPQTAALNRNVGQSGKPGWYTLELDITRLMKKDKNSKGTLDIFMDYAKPSDVRPNGFKYCWRVYSGNLWHSGDSYYSNE